MKNPLITLFLLCIASAVAAAPFPDGDEQTGKRIFDQHKCNRCHAAMLGGDGNTMFTRANRKIHSAPELIAQIKRCSGAAHARLTPQDEQHIGAYLNRFYQLK
jgi:cytochrome c2